MGATLGRLCLGACVLHDNWQPEVCILQGIAGMHAFSRAVIDLSAPLQLCEPEGQKGPCRCWDGFFRNNSTRQCGHLRFGDSL